MTRVRIGVTIHTSLRDQLFSPAAKAELEKLGEVRWTDSAAPLSEAAGIELLRDCEIGLGSWSTPCPSAGLLAACPRLRLWEHVAGSVKHMFGPHLEGSELLIASCAPAIAENVAELAVAQILLGVRGFFQNTVANRQGPCGKPAFIKTAGTSTVGVVGASAVGRRVIELLRPFKPHVLLYDPFVSSAQAVELGVELCPDLLELCRRSDVLSLHTPVTDQTKGLLQAEHFRALPDHAVFVNTARGACLDEAALIAELARGRLFAVLDVTDPEPAAPDSPLRRLANVCLTSHIAGSADIKMGDMAVSDIARFVNGGRPARVITREMLATIA